MELLITGADLYTPVGADAFQSYVAVRSGLARLVESGAVDRRQEPRLVGCLPGHTHTRDPGRLARLAAESAARTLEHAGLPRDASVLIALARPGPPRPDATGPPEPEWEAELARGLESRVQGIRLVACAEGGASFARSLQLGGDALESRRVHAVLVGGADSWLWLRLLRWLEDWRRIKTPSSTEGLIAGEAAAFVVLEGPRTARSSGRALARVVGAAHAEEVGHVTGDQPCLGAGYTEAVRQALEMSRIEQSPRTLISDLNGEAWRAREWALAEMRTLPRSPVLHLHAADCTGDVGCVSGVFGLALAAIGLSRGELPDPVLVVAGGDGPPRGVAVLAPARGPQADDAPRAAPVVAPAIAPRPEARGLVGELARDHLEEAGFLLLQRRAMERRSHEPWSLRDAFERRSTWHLLALASLARSDPGPFELAIEDPEREAADRACALASLASAGFPGVAELTGRLLCDGDEDLELLVLDAACDLPAGWARTWAESLKGASHPSARLLAARLRARTDGEGRDLAALLGDAEPGRRIAAARALAEAADADSESALLHALDGDAEEGVRIAALRALAMRGSEELARWIESGRVGGLVTDTWLLWGLCWLGQPPAVARASGLPAAERPAALVYALGVSALPEAAAPLLEHVGDAGESGEAAAIGLATLTGTFIVDGARGVGPGEDAGEEEGGWSRDVEAWRRVATGLAGQPRIPILFGKAWEAGRARRRLARPDVPNGVRAMLLAQLRARDRAPWQSPIAPAWGRA